ncbi:hypothetical protein NM688_g7234 [Phlebia brevispora]|uniref:Uncharacterized protein n=1 Tax=Phlebia brevispora TaxID=194682 RepID=A0ACC1S850_9APHY|nr:hypothetical protein NM688_g7234 [Phlebia brevispora]
MLPLPIEGSSDKTIYTPAIVTKIYQLFRDKFFTEWNTYPGHYFHAGAWWTRCSLQVWNEVIAGVCFLQWLTLTMAGTQLSDFDYVAAALNAVCKEIKDDILKL